VVREVLRRPVAARGTGAARGRLVIAVAARLDALVGFAAADAYRRSS
jgi:hypothetical protein